MKKAYAVLVPVTYKDEPSRPNVLWFDVLADGEEAAKIEASRELHLHKYYSSLFLVGQYQDFMVWPADELQACVRALEWMNEKQICPSS